MTDAIVIEDGGERGIIESIVRGKPKAGRVHRQLPRRLPHQLNRQRVRVPGDQSGTPLQTEQRNDQTFHHGRTRHLRRNTRPLVGEARQPVQIMAGGGHTVADPAIALMKSRRRIASPEAHDQRHDAIRARICNRRNGVRSAGCSAAIPTGPMSAMGHSRPGRASSKSGHVRYAAESGSKFRALAATR